MTSSAFFAFAGHAQVHAHVGTGPRSKPEVFRPPQVHACVALLVQKMHLQAATSACMHGLVVVRSVNGTQCTCVVPAKPSMPQSPKPTQPP